MGKNFKEGGECNRSGTRIYDRQHQYNYCNKQYKVAHTYEKVIVLGSLCPMQIISQVA